MKHITTLTTKFMPRRKTTVSKVIEISLLSNTQLFALSRSRGHRNSNAVIIEALETYLASEGVQKELKEYSEMMNTAQHFDPIIPINRVPQQ